MYKILSTDRRANKILIQADTPEEDLLQEYFQVLPHMLLNHAVLSPVTAPHVMSCPFFSDESTDVTLDNYLYEVTWKSAILSDAAQTAFGSDVVDHLTAAAKHYWQKKPRIMIKDLAQTVRSMLLNTMSIETRQTVSDITVDLLSDRLTITVILAQPYHDQDPVHGLQKSVPDTEVKFDLDQDRAYELMNLLNYIELRHFPDMHRLSERYDIVFLTPKQADSANDLGTRINDRLTEIRREHKGEIHTLVAFRSIENLRPTGGLKLLCVRKMSGSDIQMEISATQIKWMAANNLLLEPEITFESGRMNLSLLRTFTDEFFDNVNPWGTESFYKKRWIEDAYNLPGNPYDTLPRQAEPLYEAPSGKLVEEDPKCDMLMKRDDDDATA